MKLELGAARSGQAAAIDPRRYHEAADPKRPPIAERPPVCLYFEVTNRCNLLCTTCPRTYEALEPPADMTWDLFTRIVGQVPDLARAVLHGVGEPMLVKSLPAMVRHLKERGVYVLFNTNGTALSERNGRALIDARLDELRVSLDAATREKFRIVRGVDVFNRILKNIRRFRALQVREGAASPFVSLWLTGVKETIAELPAFVRLAADIGVGEVYLQRLVYFDADPVGLARPNQTLFECLEKDEAEILAEAEAEARRLGITFSASGAASEPGMSLTSTTRENPWSLCGRPWTLMYFTANGRALPCCIAPFAQHGYGNYTLGDVTSEPLDAIWNGARYQAFRTALQSDRPSRVCGSCGLRWSL
ncbi:MAG: radical SAM protein [Hyphomicrobiales bacterium]|nr:radical SAM protein [Hyphomicrobiales bacterium]